ncbi:6-phosphofructokinase [Herpetosiphon geysericola]|uniref:ATP-dependent 6-phosphofructokinase n=1 Tax=Herpetosiphon geysericola TaxID=70996 RepID=A0A0P6Y9Y1_9CHLR|nr:ATP-dependent 6-phosphofructokinase [Herpetosiphon geysericola]KPL86803.1 6-phosphofructokinase [Herpetosiphon geysericola]
MAIRKVAILTSGGDAPGLNGVIRAFVKSAVIEHGWEVVGIEDGFEGLVGKPRLRPLGLKEVRGLLGRGGTILGSTNKGNFGWRKNAQGELERNDAAYQEFVANAKAEGIDAVVVLGGEGSQSIAHDLGNFGLPVVGVPKTIDNDLVGTDQTFGFDTAIGVATDALDRLHTTAESHDRVMVLEVMGRHAGWIALHAGLAGGVDAILIPEIPFDLRALAHKINERDSVGSSFSIIIVAEGAMPTGGEAIYQREGLLGGIGYYVANQLATLTDKDTRAVVLGHIQRGGSPTPIDRILASRYGVGAVWAISQGRFGQLVAIQNDQLITVPLLECANKIKPVPVDGQMVRTARSLGVVFGDEEHRINQ